MADAVIVSTARTPIGKAFRGVFNDTHGADMGAHVIKHAAERAKVELGEVEDVILGCAAPEGTTGSNVARVSAIRAGAPVSVSTRSICWVPSQMCQMRDAAKVEAEDTTSVPV